MKAKQKSPGRPSRSRIYVCNPLGPPVSNTDRHEAERLIRRLEGRHEQESSERNHE